MLELIWGLPCKINSLAELIIIEKKNANKFSALAKCSSPKLIISGNWKRAAKSISRTVKPLVRVLDQSKIFRFLREQTKSRYQCFNKLRLKPWNGKKEKLFISRFTASAHPLHKPRGSFERNENVLKNAISEKWWTGLRKRLKALSVKKKNCRRKKLFDNKNMFSRCCCKKTLMLWA